jgi:hypothetical protein
VAATADAASTVTIVTKTRRGTRTV